MSDSINLKPLRNGGVLVEHFGGSVELNSAQFVNLRDALVAFTPEGALPPGVETPETPAPKPAPAKAPATRKKGKSDGDSDD